MAIRLARLGETHGNLLAQGKAMANEVADQGKRVVSETVAEVQSDLEAEGLALDEVATKTKRIAKRAATTAQAKAKAAVVESPPSR